MKDWINFYHDLGLNVIPCLPKSKKPAIQWKEYQEKKYEGTFPADCNYAVLCGRSSDNLIVLDFDFNNTDILYDIVPGAFEDTLCVLTGSEKYHVYLRVRELPTQTQRLNYNGYHLDVQAHGAYVVAPPSIHPDTNRPYRIVSTAKTIMTYDFREILVNVEKVGFTLSSSASKNISNILQGVQKGDRNSSAFKYARYLLAKVQLDPNAVLCELQRLNKLNRPPLDDRELESVWRSALKYGVGEKKVGGKVIRYVR